MSLDFRSDFFDLWVFRRADDGVEYLLLRSSQEKADRFFGGGRFWQIPTSSVGERENVPDACRRLLGDMGVVPLAAWSADHVYAIYNRRYDAVCTIPVFVAEAGEGTSPILTWEHSEFAWHGAEACLERIRFRGLRDSLTAVRETVTEAAEPSPRAAPVLTESATATRGGMA